MREVEKSPQRTFPYWCGVAVQIGFWAMIFYGFLLVWILKLDVAPFRYVEF